MKAESSPVKPVIENLRHLLSQASTFTYDNFSHRSQSDYPESFTADYLAWRKRVAKILDARFDEDSAQIHLLYDGLQTEVFGWGPARFGEMHEKIVAAITFAVEAIELDRFAEVTSSKASALFAAQPVTNRVFVVHGHDEVSKTELEIFLTEIGLEPVVLHRQVDEGKTIIEKFEKHGDVGFAFVLLTPDEISYLAVQDHLSDDLRTKEWRARPNVIFEFGYFIGRLGRSRVCCLYKSPVTVPSDISGVLYKRFERAIEEVGYSVIRELRAAGYALKI